MERNIEYALLNLPLESRHSQLEIPNRREVADSIREQIKKKKANFWNGVIIAFLLILIIILSCAVGVLVYQKDLRNEKNETRNSESWENCSFPTLRDHLCVKHPNGTKECKLCPVNWKVFQENCYFISTNNQIKSWNDSEAFCKEMNSHLLVIENEEQMTFWDQMVGKDASYWIGLYFDDIIRNWTWVNCESCKGFQPLVVVVAVRLAP
ncbi:C-type lectin domain family 4 member D-like [Leptodactylus fuscus]